MTIPVTDAGKETEVDWDEIKTVLKIFEDEEDKLREKGFKADSVARANLISAMHLHTLAYEGDMFKAFVHMIDFMRTMWPTLREMIHHQVSEILSKAKSLTKHSKITEAEIAHLESLIINLTVMNSAPSMLTAEEIEKILKTQEIVSKGIEAILSAPTSKEVLLRVFIVMAQQLAVFEMSGDVPSARAAFMDQQQLLWPIALENVNTLLKDMAKETEGHAN
jgi:hypothetical protein